MNSKVLVCIFAATLLVSILAAGPYCSLCETMIGNVRKQFNDDFTNVTPDQLEAAMDAQCDQQAGSQATICKSIVKQDDTKLLDALKAGKSDHECCVAGALCD